MLHITKYELFSPYWRKVVDLRDYREVIEDAYTELGIRHRIIVCEQYYLIISKTVLTRSQTWHIGKKLSSQGVMGKFSANNKPISRLFKGTAKLSLSMKDIKNICYFLEED